MIDGLWTAEFGSSTGIFGGGVAVLQNGKVLGGDGGYFYLGDYRLQDRVFHAKIEVRPFIANYQSVFKTSNQPFTLELDGSLVDDNHITAQGRAKEMPHVSFGARLTRQA
jgi:hypothetical protein